MEILTFVLGELQTNCYILVNQNTEQCIIIDPADDANFISEQILRLKLKPIAIVATHGHFDHILASYELQLAFSTPFYVHEKDLFLIKNLQKNASFWTKRIIVEKSPEIIKCFKTENLKDFIDFSDFTDFKLKVIPTPGHTPGGICFYSLKEKILFTGDTLFNNGVGRTDLSYSSEKDLFASLKKLSKLPKETKIYPGHGENSTLKEALLKIGERSKPNCINSFTEVIKGRDQLLSKKILALGIPSLAASQMGPH